MNLTISPLWAFGEEPNYHIAVVQDITERKWAQEALRESEKLYRVLIENLHEGILVVRDGFIKFVNPRAVQFIGYSADELTSKSFLEVVHPGDREMVMQRHVSRMAGDATPYEYTVRIIAHDGSVKWLSAASSMITWNGERAARVCVADRTDRKQAEEALRESEERYRAVFDNAGIGIDLIDRDGRILEANPAMASILGYTEEELQHLTAPHPSMLWPPQQQRTALSRLHVVLNEEWWHHRFARRDMAAWPPA